MVDGLVLRMTADLLLDFRANGFRVGKVRLRMKPRGRGSTSFISYSSADELLRWADPVLSSRRFLCSAGSFPVLDTVEVFGDQLPFENSYRWYGVADGNPKLVTSSSYGGESRESSRRSGLERYVEWQRSRLEKYRIDSSSGIRARSDLYVDPCYVDDGYVSDSYYPTPVVPDPVPVDPPGPTAPTCAGIYVTTQAGNAAYAVIYSGSGYVGISTPMGFTYMGVGNPGIPVTYEAGSDPGPHCYTVVESDGSPSGAAIYSYADVGFTERITFPPPPLGEFIDTLDIVSSALTVPIDFSNVPFVTTLNLQEWPFTTIDISPLTNLSSIRITTSALTTVDISTMSALVYYVDFQGSSLSDVDSVINQLYALGPPSGGTLILDLGTNAPRTSASDVAYNALLADAWTIFHN